jgi:hypothetical protein
MKTEKLSDEEIESISFAFGTGDISKLIEVLRKLLYNRSLGAEVCARPVSFRKQEQMKEPCFAIGYLNSIIEYIEETQKRKLDVAKETTLYINKIIEEISSYFIKGSNL